MLYLVVEIALLAWQECEQNSDHKKQLTLTIISIGYRNNLITELIIFRSKNCWSIPYKL